MQTRCTLKGGQQHNNNNQQQKQKHKDEHVLKGAILCFPSSWSLEEQFLRPLSIIHGPIQSYDKDVTRRVQRLFDGIRLGARGHCQNESG